MTQGGDLKGGVRPGKDQEHVMPQPPGAADNEEGNGGQLQLPRRSKAPAAVFKKGVRGNYEPPEPPVSFKPGEDQGTKWRVLPSEKLITLSFWQFTYIWHASIEHYFW